MAMALIFWAKVYLIFQKKRADPEERKIDLILNTVFALLFTFASIDLFITIPEIIQLLQRIIELTGG